MSHPDAILPVSARPDFVRLPSDPRTPLTPEQTAALWGGDVNAVLVRVLHGALNDRLQHSQPTPAPAAVPKGA